MLSKVASVAVLAAGLFASAAHAQSDKQVELTFADGLLNSTTDGHVVVLFAPAGTDPQEDEDVVSSPDLFFGQNVYGVGQADTITLTGGTGLDLDTMAGVYGWPNVSLNDVAPGDYSVQAFLTPYETVTRSDGSTVSVHFPCGDGALPINSVGTIFTDIVNVTIVEGPQTVNFTFVDVTPADDFNGTEIGGCSQGNYEDLELLKYVKIRSQALSDWWGRDMYIGANVVLPAGYNASDTTTRYPVIYSQGHWPADRGAFSYPRGNFSLEWNNGTIPGTNGQPSRPAPKLIMVTFRHETPFYDDSYAVNTANIGPYGDAINDELIPYLESIFNTIPEPYARIQIGGSTGGWESAASLIFRPDLFGACFSSYPDSLDFHRHQDIPLYDYTNAYTRPNGTKIVSIRDFDENGTQINLATVEQENHWELSQGTRSRSRLQWDVWNAVFGVQAVTGYPLEPWNKVTGEIYPDSVAYWRHMDLADYIVTNWNNSRNLGAVLRSRVFVYVGTWDDYFLNEGVQQFQNRTDAAGGPGWANITILPEKPHGGNYQSLPTWDAIELFYGWIVDHAPDGVTPLNVNVTSAVSRGNTWAEVMAYGGHQAALDRQAPPTLTVGNCSDDGCVFNATAGQWDPGVQLEAVWIVNDQAVAAPFAVNQTDAFSFVPEAHSKWSYVQVNVTGYKMGYDNETRSSNKFGLMNPCNA